MPKTDLNQFFTEYMEKEPLFKDKKVLQANYTPESIPHREEQIQILASVLAPALRLEKPSNIFLYGKTGCISGDSLVYTDHGYVKIKEVEETWKVLTFNTKTKTYEWSPFIFLRFENKDKLIKITLENGLNLIVTKDHPLLNSDLKWKKANELTIKDKIVVAYDLPNLTKNEIPLELARLFGFIISDGSLNRKLKRVKDSGGYWYNADRQRLRYFSTDEFLLNQVKNDLNILFKYTPQIVKDKDKCPAVQVISQEICQLLNSNGIGFGPKSYSVCVPELIFRSSQVIQREFLKALFSGDGTVSSQTYQIEYYSNSKKLLEGVAYLLYQEGIACKIKPKSAKLNNKIFNSYRLYIQGRENLIRFFYKISFYSQNKQNKLKSMLEKYKNKNLSNTNENYLSFCIISLEEVYEPYVYDLTVPKNHNFIANSIISHNTGKTLSTKYVMHKIKEITHEKNIPVEGFYLNCKLKRVADTEYRLISQLARAFGQEVPATGLPTDEVYKLFLEKIDKEKKLIILVLDEIDQLVKKAGDEILYNLTRINSELKNVEICLIGISNDLLFTDNLDPRVKSSLSEEELVFPPYNAIQLQDILKERANKAFRDNVLAPGVVEKCAAYAAREHGDARRALELLRVAGELAERQNHPKINIEHIDQAEEKIERDRVLDIIHTQPKQFQLSLLAIFELSKKSDNLSTGDVFSSYRSYCIKIGLKPLTQRRVSDIISELDMLGIITARVISKGRYGRTREITLGIPSSSVPSLIDSMKEALNL